MTALTQNSAKEMEFFAKFVAEHGNYDPMSEVANERILNRFQQDVRPQPEEKVLDMGCGTGAFTRRLAAFGLTLSGIDFCKEMIDFANRHFREATLQVADIRSSGLPAQSFDIVIYSGVLHHFPAESDRVAALKEGFRVLKPGGRLFAYEPNAISPSMWLYRSPGSPVSRFFKDRGQTADEILLSKKQLAVELTKAGFGEITIRGLSGMSLRETVTPISKIIRPFYNLYEGIVHWSPFEKQLGTFLTSFAVKPVRTVYGSRPSCSEGKGESEAEEHRDR